MEIHKTSCYPHPNQKPIISHYFPKCKNAFVKFFTKLFAFYLCIRFLSMYLEYMLDSLKCCCSNVPGLALFYNRQIHLITLMVKGDDMHTQYFKLKRKSITIIKYPNLAITSDNNCKYGFYLQ